MEVTDLTFDFATVVTIFTIVVAGLSSLFYFRSAFKTNATEINGRIAAMEALNARTSPTRSLRSGRRSTWCRAA